MQTRGKSRWTTLAHSHVDSSEFLDYLRNMVHKAVDIVGALLKTTQAVFIRQLSDG